MKRSHTIKRIVAIMLCMVIALTGLNVQTASAASGKVPLKVTFKGKTAALVKDMSKENYDYPTIKSLTSKWGKPKKTQVELEGRKHWKYTWKKGKTEIVVTTTDGEKGFFFSGVSIEDKNGALCGVKVGMKKADALKKFKKALGLKNKYISIDDDSISMGFYELENGAYYGAYGFELKNGKVSRILWKNGPSTPLFME